MTILATMYSEGLMQCSSGCTTGKEWRKMYSCTANTARYAPNKKWIKLSTSRTISDLGVCPWSSSPWTWLEDFPGHPVAMNMPSQWPACWQAMYSVSHWRPNQQRKLWTNTLPMSPSHLGTAEKSCQIMVQSSKMPCLRRWPNNWVWKEDIFTSVQAPG